MNALADETVASNRDRRPVILALPLFAQSARGEVIDTAARQRLQLIAVDTEHPAGKMPHGAVEKPLPILRIDVGIRGRVEERAPIEDDQLVAVHDSRSGSCRNGRQSAKSHL